MNKITFINNTIFPIVISHGEKKIKLNSQDKNWFLQGDGLTEIEVKIFLWTFGLKNYIEKFQIKNEKSDATIRIFFNSKVEIIMNKLQKIGKTFSILCISLGAIGFGHPNPKYYLKELWIIILIISLIRYFSHIKKLKSLLNTNEKVICLEKSN